MQGLTYSYHCFKEMYCNASLELNLLTVRQTDGQTNRQKFELLCCTLLQIGATKYQYFLAQKSTLSAAMVLFLCCELISKATYLQHYRMMTNQSTYL